MRAVANQKRAPLVCPLETRSGLAYCSPLVAARARERVYAARFERLRPLSNAQATSSPTALVASQWRLARLPPPFVVAVCETRFAPHHKAYGRRGEWIGSSARANGCRSSGRAGGRLECEQSLTAPPLVLAHTRRAMLIARSLARSRARARLVVHKPRARPHTHKRLRCSSRVRTRTICVFLLLEHDRSFCLLSAVVASCARAFAFRRSCQNSPRIATRVSVSL